MPEVAQRIDASFSLMNDLEGLLSCDRFWAHWFQLRLGQRMREEEVLKVAVKT